MLLLVMAIAIAVMLQVLWGHAQIRIQIVQVIVMFVLQVTVKQVSVYVLATVMSVLVQVQHITVLQVMLFVQVQLPHVAVQVAELSLIVAPVLLIHMVYVVIQHVVVILVAKHMIMGYSAEPATPVVMALVAASQLAPMGMVVQPRIIAATGVVGARHLVEEQQPAQTG